MKTIILILIPIGLYAQPDSYTYSEVIQVDANSDELYSRARQWFAYNFNSANNVLQMDDKELGQLIGKGNFSVSVSALGNKQAYPGGHVNFTVSIAVKEGRYKYDIELKDHEGRDCYGGDIREEKPDCGFLGMIKKQWREVQDQSQKKALIMVASIQKAMAGQTDQNDDW